MLSVQCSRIGRRGVVGLVLLFTGAVSAAPAEYVWTGAQDAYWTNAANWKVGGAVATDAPGVRFLTKGPDWRTFTNLNATASFDAVAGGARTTVDLDGLFFVSNLVVKAGAPKYTFGTEGQYLGLAHEGGRFTVEKGAAAPTVAGVYGLLYRAGMPQYEADTYDTPDEARFVNEADGELVLSNFGKKSPNAPSVVLWYRSFGFGGTGNVKIVSWSQSQSCVGLNLYPEGDQRLRLVGTTADPNLNQLVRRIQVGGGRSATVEVVGGMLELGQGIDVQREKATTKCPVVRVRDAGTRLTFMGEGVVGLHGMNQKSKPEKYGKGFVPAGADIDAGAELVFACKVDGFVSSKAGSQKDSREGFYFHRGAGTLSFTRTDNAFEGGIDLLSFDKNATLAFTDPAQMGPGAIRIGNAGRLLYTGTEALALGKDLAITNKSVGVDFEYTNVDPVDASATVEQGGAGALTVTSPVDVSGTGGKAVLTLANSTAVAATWAGVLTDAADDSKLALAKTGSGAWTLTAKNTFTGGTTVSAGTLVLAAAAGLASPVTIRGGATFAPAKGAALTSPVTIEDGGTLSIAESQTLPFTVRAAGTAKLLVGPGADVVIPAEGSGPAAGGKLVLCLEENARVKMSDGTKPDWLGFASPRGLLMPMKVDKDGFFELVETTWKGAGGAVWTDAANWTKGVPTVDCAAIVNAAGTVEVPADAEAVAVGTVELDAGTVSVKGTLPIEAAANVERFVIGPEGALAIDGGTVTAKHALGAEDYALHLEGGSLALTGAAMLDLRESKGLLGTGSVTVDTTADAAIQVSKDEYQEACFSTGDSEGTLEMTVGRQAFALAKSGRIVFGDSQKGTFRLTVEDRGPGDTSALLVKGRFCPYDFYVGRQAGVADVVLQSGRLGGSDGICKRGVIVAGVTGANAVVTGRVTVAGGQVAVSASRLSGYWSGIGFGVSTQKTEPSAVRGELKLEAGLVQVSNKSPLGFGVGNAMGVGLQTGGTVDVTRSAGAVVLGYGSGTGEYVLSNGTFATGRPLYVGGCRKADVQASYTEGESPAGRGAATGRFFARGGTLAATNELGIVVGADGKGRLEIGPDGNVTAKALVVSNNVENKVEGVLAFELGPDKKVGSLRADTLAVAPGAKLEIDARAVGTTDSSILVKLVDCKKIEGAFSSGDVTIIPPKGEENRFRHAAVFTEWKGEKGLWFRLPPLGLMILVR